MASIALLAVCLPGGPTSAQVKEMRTVVFGTVVAVPGALSILLDQDRRVQLIGVNVVRGRTDEETLAFASDTAAYLKTLAEGKRVWLEFDDVRSTRDGRILAYVYRYEDGLQINAELIRRGYGTAIKKVLYNAQNEFRTLEAKARKELTGLWGKLPVPPDPKDVVAAKGGVIRNTDGTVRETAVDLSASGQVVTNASPRSGEDDETSGPAANPGAYPTVGVTSDGVYHSLRHLHELSVASKGKLEYTLVRRSAAEGAYRVCQRCRGGAE